MSDDVVGFSAHRLKRDDPYNADEVKLSDMFNLWKKRNPRFWDFMTGCNSRGTEPEGFLSERELKIVATTIQWLGTPVGKSFLQESGLIK